ncbi:hypothetical protein BC351_10300 [Paenibacillus ferrarius]|uniref:BppU N-terminal domain-containing protein n=1 Tax=Paenibacillus ferrarius TaxID=1469647 RepID=A0A1V4H8P1_9BACL|nr:hypothetical protein [Paenibacillus ferrarius]OPH47574.1 hypothetical protein BC351_10300 [Paenibacillus ferrarius]
MPELQTYLEYNDPLSIIYRAGTPNDPYKDRLDSLPVINNQITLLEIPSEFHKVKISGYTEINNDIFRVQNLINSNEFLVNYSNGNIQFNPSEEGKTLLCESKGRGLILYPASRIYAIVSRNPDVVKTLQDIIDEALLKISQANMVIKDVKVAIRNAEAATTNANTATDNASKARDNAILATEETNIATSKSIVATTNAVSAALEALNARDLAIDARNQSILLWQHSVPSRDVLEATYPTPKTGWTVSMDDTGVVYRFDGTEWKDIGNMVGAVPLVNSTLDGLMRFSDYVKLKAIEPNAQVNFVQEDAKNVLPDYFRTKTITFMFASVIDTGLQEIEIKFPYHGEITDITASCSTEGSDVTEIEIEKASEADYKAKNPWANILSRNVSIHYGEKVDDHERQIVIPQVNKNDYFRVNVKKIGTGLANLVVQIEVKI